MEIYFSNFNEETQKAILDRLIAGQFYVSKKICSNLIFMLAMGSEVGHFSEVRILLLVRSDVVWLQT